MEDTSAKSDAEPVLSPPVRGAGGSAEREYERRHSAREERVRARNPKIGGLLLALTDDPVSTKVWAQGAAGERAVALRLDSLEHAIVLHDRRLRRPDGRQSRSNIDHIAVTPSGVWVIDAKTHRGTLEIRRTGGLFSPRTERLVIRGRDQTGLVDGVQRQADAVRAALGAIAPEVAVRAALCFVGTELPWLDQDVAGVPVKGRRGLLALLRRRGPLGPNDRTRIAAHLDRYFIPAT